MVDRKNTTDVDAAIRQRDFALALLDSVPEALVVVDEQSRIQVFNRQAENIFGYLAEEVSGKPISMLLEKTIRKKHEDLVEKYMRQPETRLGTMEAGGRAVVGLTKSGKTVALEINLTPLTWRTGRYIVATARPKRMAGNKNGF